jgi:hypothetical protein
MLRRLEELTFCWVYTGVDHSASALGVWEGRSVHGSPSLRFPIAERSGIFTVSNLDPFHMRTAIFLLVILLATQVSAQRGKGSIEERSTMVDDSVRQVERVDTKRDMVVSRRFYVGERPVGVWQEFDKKGGLVTVRDFDKMSYGMQPGLRMDGSAEDSTSKTVVERMPEFPGGEAELFKFLGQNIKYPGEALDEGVSGVVYLVGIVDETGDWRTITVMKGVHPFLDFEAWRVTESMPDWTPGIVDGKPARVQYNLPIRFTIR